jgi:large subunit ribosomal protein L10
MKKISVIIKESSENRIKESFKKSDSFFVVKYEGLSSPDVSSLRMALRVVNAQMFVVKNTIARRALKEFANEEAVKCIEGTCGLIFFQDDPVATSKVLFSFFKDHEKLKVEGGFLIDKSVTGKELERLSKLPSKDVLRAQVVMALKSPIFGLVMVLKGNLRKLVWCLEQIKNKKQ